MLLALGSRGDVEPLALLAGALTAPGGTPAIVVAASEYEALVRSHGAGFAGIGFVMADMERLGRGWLGRAGLRSPLAQPALLARWFTGLAAPFADTVLEVVRPGCLVVTGVAARDSALALVQSHGCRMATVLHTAVLPTAQPESHLEGHRRLGSSRVEAAASRWYWEAVSGLSRSAASVLRERTGLHPASARASTAAADRYPILLAADPVLVPPAPDWPQTCRQTGAVLAPAAGDWEPPEPLRSFLAAGEPPVYVGLGSLNGMGGQDWLALVEYAARLSGRRVATPALPGETPRVLGGGRVCTVADAPHAALFPRLSGIVHHGGAGTTAAALRAGVPSVGVPAMFDQHYHARRLAELGVGPWPVPLHRITGARLAVLLAGVAGGAYAERAAAVGAEARSSDGLSTALAALQGLSPRPGM